MKDGSCADMDECIMNLDFKCQKDLSIQIMCLNTEGSYTCACNTGFVSTSACPDGWSEHSGHCHLWRGDQDRILKSFNIY